MSKRKQIKLLRLTSSYYFPKPTPEGWPIRFDPIGGMEIQIANISKMLVDEEIDQTALILGMPGIPRALRLAPNCVLYSTRAPMPILIKTESGRGTIGLEQSWAIGAFSWLLLNRLRKKQREYDIIHAHGNGYAWPLLIGIIAKKLYRLPLVLTIHCSCIATYSPISGLDKSLRFIARFAERCALSNAEKIIALTSKTANFYTKAKLAKSSDICVIPDCIDVRSFRSLATQQNKERFCLTYGVPLNKKIVIFLGRLAPEKGWWFFIEVASRIQRHDVHFLICGGGVQEEKAKRMIHESGLDNRITLTGFVPHELIPSALSMSTVFACTSVHEELGSSILEAMAVGCPIVAHNVGGIPNIVEDGVSALLVPLGNIDRLVKAIETLIDCPKEAQKLSDEAYRVIKERFDTNVIIPRIMDVYNEIAREESSLDGI